MSVSERASIVEPVGEDWMCERRVGIDDAKDMSEDIVRDKVQSASIVSYSFIESLSAFDRHLTCTVRLSMLLTALF